MLALVALYLVVVRYGPRVMKNRQPLELKPLMFVYNFALVLLSFYMSLEVGLYSSRRAVILELYETVQFLSSSSFSYFYQLETTATGVTSLTTPTSPNHCGYIARTEHHLPSPYCPLCSDGKCHLVVLLL